MIEVQQLRSLKCFVQPWINGALHKSHPTVWKSSVSPAPTNRTIAGIQRDLPWDLRNIVSPQTRDLPWACARRYFYQKGLKYTTPGCPHICQDSDQRRPGLWGRNLPGDLQEKCPPQSQAVPRAVPWTSQSTKLNPRVSSRYPWVVGAGVSTDGCIKLHQIGFEPLSTLSFLISTSRVKMTDSTNCTC